MPALAADRRDYGFTFSTTQTGLPTPSEAVPYDTRPISEAQMIAIHLYVYGGLVFFILVIISAAIWYAYIICYGRKMRDLPEDLHLDDDFVLSTQNLPRRAGFKVYAYEERPEWQQANDARRIQEEKTKARAEYATEKRRSKRAFLFASRSRNSQRVSWASSIATLRPSAKGKRDSSVIPGAEEGSLSSTQQSAGKGKRVSSISWAKKFDAALPRPKSMPKSILLRTSGTSTSTTPRVPGTFGGSVMQKRTSFNLPDGDAVPPVPQAHTEEPRSQVHLEPMANMGNEMFETTGPEEAASWAGPRCTCNMALEGVDAMVQKAMCEVHRFQK